MGTTRQRCLRTRPASCPTPSLPPPVVLTITPRPLLALCQLSLLNCSRQEISRPRPTELCPSLLLLSPPSIPSHPGCEETQFSSKVLRMQIECLSFKNSPTNAKKCCSECAMFPASIQFMQRSDARGFWIFCCFICHLSAVGRPLLRCHCKSHFFH